MLVCQSVFIQLREKLPQLGMMTTNVLSLKTRIDLLPTKPMSELDELLIIELAMLLSPKLREMTKPGSKRNILKLKTSTLLLHGILPNRRSLNRT